MCSGRPCQLSHPQSGHFRSGVFPGVAFPVFSVSVPQFGHSVLGSVIVVSLFCSIRLPFRVVFQVFRRVLRVRLFCHGILF